MSRAFLRSALSVVAIVLGVTGSLAAVDVARLRPDGVAIEFVKLGKGTRWTQTASVPLGFRSHHPQGMVKVRDEFFLSSVEIIERTQRFDQPVGGYDRTPGKGQGHLFRFDAQGRLLADVTLGQGDAYHPGGIDYDGRYLWVPVAEYRPNSASVVYRVDAATMEVKEVLRVRDHIGGVVHNTQARTLHGVSWGSRRFYRWELTERLDVGSTPPQIVPNGNHYIDYQDCHYLEGSYMLCSGLNAYEAPGAVRFAFGGIDLVDLSGPVAVHQVPVALWAQTPMKPMTQNPFFAERVSGGLRFYFVPEDDSSTMYVFETRS